MCPDKDKGPQACPTGTIQSSDKLSCISAIAGSISSDPELGQLQCSAPTFFSPTDGQSSCQTCPAGYSCTTTTKSACVAGQYSSAGSGSCSTATIGYFAKSTAFSQQQCPTGTYQTQTGQSECNQCDAGKSCADTTSSPVTCASKTFSALGATKCQSCYTGYQCTDVTQAVMTPCADGYYSTSGTCTTCPAGSYCSESAIIGTCPLGTYSTAGGKGCLPCPNLYQCPTATTKTACNSTTYVDPLTSTCKVCPSGSICGPTILSPRKCPTGYYTTNLNTCLICPEGSSCPTASAAVTCGTAKYSGTGFTSCLSCPAGYDCSLSKKKSEITKCASGYYAVEGAGQCTKCAKGKICPYTDMTTDTCPAGTYKDTEGNSFGCSVCSNNNKCPTEASTTQTACATSGEYSPFGSSSCLTCPTTGDCTLEAIGNYMDCQVGYFYDSSTKICTVCPEGYECLNNTKQVCPLGTKYESGTAKCVECPDNMICVYNSKGQSTANNYCYGKNPGEPLVITEFQSSNRLPFYNYQYCIDCNSVDLLSKICTFSTNYFTTQTGQNISCPTGSRYETRIVRLNGNNYTDARWWDLTNSAYPYCKQGMSLYTAVTTSSWTENTAINQARINEYTGSNYKMLKPSFPGFMSSSETPTYSALTTAYSTLEQSADLGTQNLIKPCGDGLHLVTEGAASESQACKLRYTGYCKYSETDYCFDGDELMCPHGFVINSDTTKLTKKGLLDCIQCASGVSCNSDDTRNRTCDQGYFCPVATEQKKQFASRPGTKIENTAAISSSGESTCTGGYCPAASSSSTTCPLGYTLEINMRGHNLYNCEPNQPGQHLSADGATSTTCTAGSYCPEALKTIQDMIPCQPGHYHYSVATGLQEKSQCTACPQGKFCPEKSTSAEQVSCTAGYFCPNRTRHLYENPCPASSTSTAGATDVTSCTSCSSGFYCKEGTGSPQTCPKNTYCPTDSSFPQDCPIGTSKSSATQLTSSTSCETCPTNYLCPGGTDPIACPAGYSLANDANNTDSRYLSCILASNGTYTYTAGSTKAICTPGKHSYAGSMSCFVCPEGKYCAFGQINDCPSGQYCVKNSFAPQSCPSGMKCSTLAQDRLLPCPSGQYCQNGVATATPAGQFNVQGETSYTANPCGNGYLCTGGSTGPFDSPCPVNTYAALGATTCSACPAGKFCPPGSISPGDCPIGFYCTGTDSQPMKCPKGTYGASTNLSQASECTPCPAGKTCSQSGLTASDGECDPGYYCTGGSWTPQPDETDSLEKLVGGLCPIGSYCPKGTATPMKCPSGTYNSFPGMRSTADCISCTPGFYCEGSNNPAPTGTCYGGYYCEKGSSIPTQNAAEAGYYAINGSSTQIQCLSGTYSDSTASTSCKLCEAGQYCDEIGMSAGVDCPAGSYCPSGSINPIPCKIGTFNPLASSSSQNSCQNCTAGKYCDEEGLTYEKGTCAEGYFCLLGSPSQTPAINLTIATNQAIYALAYGLCPRGYYCPAGTSTPSACLVGYYLDSEGAKAQSDCKQCAPGYYCSKTGLAAPEGKCSAGYYCPAGSTVTTQTQCSQGYYCPEGTANQIQCEAGTYQDQVGQSSCITCTSGNYCPQGSTSQTPCPQGSYCSGGTKYALENECQLGYVNDQLSQSSSLACIKCPVGQYCKTPNPQKGVGTIADGYYNQDGASSSSIPSTSTGRLCGTGFTCTAGVETACTAGKYCNDYGISTPTGDCQEGYYCQAGAKSSTPVIITTDQGSRCPTANYCIAGSVTSQVCPIGTYSNGIGLFALTDCNKCPAGYICDQTSTTDQKLTSCPAGNYCNSGAAASSDAVTCPAGFYCPTGSLTPIPCPSGQHQPSQGQTSCIPCTIGSYCPYQTSTPLTPPTGYISPKTLEYAPIACSPGTYKATSSDTSCSSCPVGYYCDTYGVEGPLDSTRECPAGYYCPQGTSNYQDNMCQPGYYCPQKSSAQTSCDEGKYCADYALGAPSGNCEAGYYCISKATKPNPEDTITGYLCPQGQYCLSGQKYTKCPSGTYNDKDGASESSYCLSCPSNKICTGEGLAVPAENCPAGYYCSYTNGILSKTPCEQGYKCPAGELSKLKCEPGTYQPSTGQGTCITCPAGFYCYNSDNSPIIAAITCPAGFYCLEGTGHYEITPCPIGTYNPSTGKNSLSQCTDCDAGSYCNKPGLSAVSGKCLDGFVCAKKSTTAAGTALCPKNNYCVAGVTNSCPAGTYTKVEGAAASSECSKCPPGKYCPTQDANIKDCPMGSYCSGGISTTNSAVICPAGSYCPLGSAAPQKCSPGTFMSLTGRAQCTICTLGKYCDESGMTTPKDCIQQYTCPQGSRYPRPCSIGFYATSTNQCLACPAGRYCWPELGTYGNLGNCAIGYVCQNASYSPRPFADTSVIKVNTTIFSTYNGPALPGYASTDGKTNSPCAVGTWQPSKWGQSCLPCYAGYYCSSTRMSVLSFSCAANKYCPQGSIKNTGTCSNGYTTITAAQPHCIPCQDGYYSDDATGCKACLRGKYCNNSMLYSGQSIQQTCPDQSLCTGGNAYQPSCSDGKYLFYGQCQTCDSGKYCLGGVSAGECTAGYYCSSGAQTPAPQNSVCDAGFYCPHGTTEMRSCPYGYYRADKGGIQKTDCTACMAGYLCTTKKGVPNECPKGFYCPFGATEASPCPKGTYSDVTLLISPNDCKNCPAGYFCNKTNITDYTSYPCPVGKYCPERTLTTYSCPAGYYRDELGAKSEEDCYDCPAGYYCPEGSIYPTRCLPGTYCPVLSRAFKTCRGGYYCNEDTNYQEQTCPLNYYCPRGSANPTLCDGRLICTEGSELGTFCQAGYYVNQGLFGLQNECLSCPEGTYSTAADATCQPCTGGYLCYGATNRKRPTSYTTHRGEICPKGNYCEEGSSTATPCPAGTYNPEYGAESITQCLLCPENTFNDVTGQSGCRPCGAYATAIEGSQSCLCSGNFRTFSLADSSCRCMSGYDYIDPITTISKGKESGYEDCNPLVYDRCDGTNQTRNVNGQCVDIYDCSEACNGGKGTRSLNLGVCTCEDKPNVDLVCNQNCRQSATQLSVVSPTTITLSKNGQASTLDLTLLGDVYGGLSCDSTNCSVRSTELPSSGGFLGNYGASSLIESSGKRLRRMLAQEGGTLSKSFRDLQSTVETNTASIRNPVTCLKKGDSMLFTISSPSHYPVYLKDSIMNSNPNFDYGAFLILANQMTTKAANNITTPSLFAFTFTAPGSYVFSDSASTEQLLLIRVVATSETCPDPDRYIQPLGSTSASSAGISQNPDIIIKPDVPLLIGMSALLILSVVTVMVGVGYCLHKGWSIRKASLNGYRQDYVKLNVDHKNEETFEKKNDFSKYKTHLGDSDEDDLDHINLDIHQDLVRAGQDYLKIFEDKKVQRGLEKRKKKQEILNLMKELEELISVIGSDALKNQMQLYNGDDEEKLLQKELKMLEDKEQRDRENEEAKRQQMQKEWSDRDRKKLEETKNNLQQKGDMLKKELHQGIQTGRKGIDRNAENQKYKKDQMTAEDMAMAIYDGGDANSRQNQIVKNIENDQNLSDEDKDALLRSHYKHLLVVDELLDGDRKKQDYELEKALKERIDRRKKALEAKYKKEITNEIKDRETDLKAQWQADKQQALAEIDEDFQQQMDDLTANLRAEDTKNYRQWVDELKRQRDEKKKLTIEEFDEDWKRRYQAMKDEVLAKYTQGVGSDSELESLLMQQNSGMEYVMQGLKEQRAEEEEKLREELKRLKKELKTQLKKEQEEIIQEVMNKDPIVEEELEKKKQEILKQNGMASEEPESEQELAQKKVQEVLDNIDSTIEASRLLNQFNDTDTQVQDLLKDSEEDQQKKLDARRELLRQRKLLKKQQELEEKRIQERVKQVQQEDEHKAALDKQYIRQVFQQSKELEDPSQIDKQTIQQKVMILNEFVSDAFLERLSNLLMRQFLEKEQMLKLILQKYMDQRVLEKSNIKRQFKDEYEKLNSLKDQLSEEDFNEALKTLRLNEENLLREVDLHFDKAHKEEELRLRAQLERDHTEQQMALRKEEVEDQIALKKELNLITDDKQEEQERQALKSFLESKQRDQDRKLRALGLQKQELLRAIDQELENKYNDYEQLLQRKREEDQVVQEQQLNIRKKLQERRKKLRESGTASMSAADQQKMLDQYRNQLETLESVFEEERRRQLAIMTKKLNQKKTKMVKLKDLKAKVDEQEVDSIKQELAFSFGQKDGSQMVVSKEDSELLKALRAWREKRMYMKREEEEKQLGETPVDLEPMMLKRLIQKLDSLEKGLRELRKLKRGTVVVPQQPNTNQKRASPQQDKSNPFQSVASPIVPPLKSHNLPNFGGASGPQTTQISPRIQSPFPKEEEKHQSVKKELVGGKGMIKDDYLKFKKFVKK